MSGDQVLDQMAQVVGTILRAAVNLNRHCRRQLKYNWDILRPHFLSKRKSLSGWLDGDTESR